VRARLLGADREIETLDFGMGGTPDGRPGRERLADLCRVRSKPIEDAVMLFRLVRLLRPKCIIELGTACGLSAATMACALKLDGNGVLVTVEGDPNLAALARDHARDLELPFTVVGGRFADVVPNLLMRHRFDFAFVDGHHDETETVRWYEALARTGSDEMAIVLDDIDWSDGMRAAWAAVRAHPRTLAHADLRGIGICFTRGDG
jgi:predicted O-methyltransferase YrrM